MKSKTNKTQTNKKMWGGRFQEKMSSIMERIGESISFDKRLYREDITGSLAHAKGLEKIGILSRDELKNIQKGLSQILHEIESGEFEFHSALEDIHMHIESRLTDLIGNTGKKLHTARSRNDQVSQDVRLYILKEIQEIRKLIFQLLETLLLRAEESVNTIMPGFTHLQVAQPIRASHYFLSYFSMFLRDYEELDNVEKTTSILVLGSGAMAGVNYPTDRDFLKNELQLNSISLNSMDAVSSRDHILQFLFFASQCMVHLSRFSEDTIIYTSQDYSYIQLSDSLTTGSSIMPQKKNPDIAELIRGKTARVISNLNSLFILLKGLPMTYNRDLQEDKISLFDSVDQLKISLEGITEIVKSMKFIPENMESALKKGFATATDLADFLVREKNIPFREAHELVGKLVEICVKERSNLFDLPEEKRKNLSDFFIGEEYFEAISLYNSCDKKDVYGGTAKNRQIEQIEFCKNKLQEIKIKSNKVFVI
ncbi:MAG: argininosuccinate lyase [Leptospiraceae bacterium]|nr:argininosuccinate lyase [Leptospiraceae bacterium]MCK6379709.1 argininosuccinate lyase [Leptospiraceae bacterium]NUM40513.1 argininosuccinate lyase [Leptospiraceae bacterium]